MKWSVFRFSLLIVLFIKNSSSRILIVVKYYLLSPQLKSTGGRVILYGEMLYTCKVIMSEFEFFM